MLFSSQAPVDVVPPVVNVTAPADGATVSGTVEVTATATDDTGVAGVQLLIDATNTGPEDTTSPYTLTWNTLTAANGTHTITARARDLAGNLTTSAPVTVTVTNTADSGLLAAYGMETGSGTTLTDSSPNAANAELTDGTWTTGRYGNAVAFNGTTTRARTTTNLALGNAFTLQAWVNNPTNEAYETILTVGTTRDLYLAGGQLSFYSDAISTTFGAIPTGSWQHVAVTYDGTTLRAYLNGAPLGAPQAATIAPVTAPLQAGAWIFGAANADYFSGTLDEVRVQSRALTQAEIQTDLNTPVVAPPTGPVDVVPPVVNVTAPADGATVSGTVEVTATATDDTGVAGVQLLIDATNAGPEDTTSPYTLTWNTLTAANGTHTITARARDLAGNLTTSAPVTVTVTNTADSGLLAAYGMETGSGTTLTDSSPNAANAELTDGTWTTGRYGNAVAFNGTTTRARTTTTLTLGNLALGNAFTLQAWVNNPTNEAYETILTVGQERSLFLAERPAGPGRRWHDRELRAPARRGVDARRGHLRRHGPAGLRRRRSARRAAGHRPRAGHGPPPGGRLDLRRGRRRLLLRHPRRGPRPEPGAHPGRDPDRPRRAPVVRAGAHTAGRSGAHHRAAHDRPAHHRAAHHRAAHHRAGRRARPRLRLQRGHRHRRSRAAPPARPPPSPAAHGPPGATAPPRLRRQHVACAVRQRAHAGDHLHHGGLGQQRRRAAVRDHHDGRPEPQPLPPRRPAALRERRHVRELRQRAPHGGLDPLAVTYDGTTMRAYADGVLLGTPQAIPLAPVTAALQVGAWISGANSFDYLSGAIDEVRLYDRALSPTEIQADLGTPIG